jgi:hypothetical protein
MHGCCSCAARSPVGCCVQLLFMLALSYQSPAAAQQRSVVAAHFSEKNNSQGLRVTYMQDCRLRAGFWCFGGFAHW